MAERENTPCYHCKEACKDDSIHIDDKVFCCQGCKIAYQVLNDSGMCTYYEIDENAGVSLKGKKQEQFSYLDDPGIIADLIDFSNGDTTKVTFYVPSIHCASCLWLLENLYRLNPAIKYSRVNFLKKEVYITFSEKDFSLRRVVELLDSIGYKPAINLGSSDRKKSELVDKSFYYKLGYAGFAFGNIMLMSFPEYLGLGGDGIDADLRRFFGYLNVLLALPVVFYSASDYIRSAWLGLKGKDLNIDVPITIGIFSIFFRSLYEIFTGMGAGFLDSLTGLVFFLLVGKWFQQKTYHRLSFERDYKSYFPIAATVKTDEGLKQLPVKNLKSGDTILVKNGELITADGILLKGEARIDYSFVTGESDPVIVQPGEKVYAGGKQIGPRVEITLTKNVSQSYLTELWNDDTFKENKVAASASQLADKIGKYFTYVVLTVAFATLFYWLPRDASVAISAFSAVLVIACPCAVSISIPFTFGNVLRILARNRFYLKNTNVIEAVQKVNFTIFDKTGTITHASENAVKFVGMPLQDEDKQLIKTLVHNSAHPLSRQIDAVLEGDLLILEHFREVTGMGIEGVVAGHQVMLGSASFVEATETAKGVYVKIDDVIKGYFEIDNKIRRGADKTLDYFQENYEVALLSGDNDKEKNILLSYFKDEGDLYFNKSPHDKLAFAKKIQEEGKVLMMIGDGLNDAGALQQSQVGIVVTENINNFTPACDAIMDADKFDKLPVFMEYMKKSLKLVYYAYFIALTYNVIGMSFAVRGLLSPVIAAVLMPLSSISIAVFGVFSSSFLAYRLGLYKRQEEEGV